MTGLAAAALCLAAVCAYVGIYHLILFFRANGPRESAAFSLACFAVMGYDLCSAGLYNLAAAEQAAFWQRGQMVMLCLLGIFLLRFVSLRIDKPDRPLDLVFFAYFLCQAMVLLIDRSDLTWSTHPAVKQIQLAWGPTVTYHEMAPGLLIYAQTAAGGLVCVYVLFSLARAYRKDPRADIGAIWGGTACLVLGVLNDAAVSLGVYSFIYVIEYAFLCLVIAMAYAVALRHAAFRTEALRLATAVENAWESIVITDSRGFIEYVNPHFEQVTGWARAEVVGKRPGIISSGKHDSAFYEDLWRTLNAGKAWTGDFTNRKRNGGLYVERALIYPVRDDRGRTVNFVSVQHDVSQERALEAQLRQSQKMEAVGRLAAGVAHDFTNVLVLLMNQAMQIKKQLAPDAQAYVKANDMLKSIERAGNLTAQLMAFAHQQPAAFHEEDLARVVGGVETILKRTVGAEVDLDVHLGETGVVLADAGQIEQMLIHLVVNACDAMPEGGLLTIDTGAVTLSNTEAMQLTAHGASATPARGGHYATLSVSDSGTGIRPAVLDCMFDPFFTTKQGTLRTSGLGLSTVYAMVEQHHGYITVHTHTGQGTTFTILLPSVAAQPLPPAPPAPTCNVLVVVSEPLARSTLTHCLTASGCTVSEAENVAQARKIDPAARAGIDLVLIEMFRDGDGEPPARDAPQLLAPGAAVVFVSGYSPRHLIRRGLITPRDSLVSVPFSRAALATAMRRALRHAA